MSRNDVFNPRILEAIVREVVSRLPNNAKADALLHAIQHMDVKQEGARSVIDNATASCLLVTGLSSENAIRAYLLRAKSNLAGGYYTHAENDLHAILKIDPNHLEALSLVKSRFPKSDIKFSKRSRHSFSTEVYREIALYLGRHDLRTLLQVPNVLSRIASELLFRSIDLHFDDDQRASQRSADLVTQIILEPTFGALVRSLRVFYPVKETTPQLAFQTGILVNALPKLPRLKNVHLRMPHKDLSVLLPAMKSNNSGLEKLSIDSVDGIGELKLPDFSHLRVFCVESHVGAPLIIQDILDNNSDSLRALLLCDLKYSHRLNASAIQNLTDLDITGSFSGDAFAHIFANATRLEAIRFACNLRDNPAAQFRQHTTSLPHLRHFSLYIVQIDVQMQPAFDLFPAVAEMLQGRVALRTLELRAHTLVIGSQCGFTAVVWGLLPSLTKLHRLSITLPEDVAPSLATWLIPRSVKLLKLFFIPSRPLHVLSFVTQLRAGVPPGLQIVCLPPAFGAPHEIVKHGFPMIKVLFVGLRPYTVIRVPGRDDFELEEWPEGRSNYHRVEWVEHLGCEGVVEESPFDFRGSS